MTLFPIVKSVNIIMPMAQKTSVNIKPCNIGSSEEHNRRKAEYLARVNKDRLYIRTDLMPRNEAWVAPEFENSTLTDRYWAPPSPSSAA